MNARFDSVNLPHPADDPNIVPPAENALPVDWLEDWK